MFLNNRYHDPTLGTFISVDPLVTQTGEPYIYASGNPTTLSDPSGLCSHFFGDADQWTCEFYNPPNEPGDAGRTTTISGQGGYTSDCRSSDGGGCHSPAPEIDRVDLTVEWAGCMSGGSAYSCGVPLFDGGGGQAGKGPHSYHQAWWCVVHGNCKQIWDNNWLARDQLEIWRNSPEFRDAAPDDLNALLHAFWFALNASSYLEVSDDALRDFGIAHEQDWRDGLHDVARDLLNNEVGIGLGEHGLSYDEVVALVEDAALGGQLSCVSGEQVASCSFAG